MPGENIQDWSTTAASNSNADSAINWAEGQPRNSVNNSARSMLAAHAKDRNLHNGSITTTGSANAYAFASGLGYTVGPIPTGMRVTLFLHQTNTTAATLNMDSIGAVAILNTVSGALVGGELIASTYVEFIYNGTNWIIAVNLSSKVSKSGDTMTGPLVVSSTITATGVIDGQAGINAGGVGFTTTGNLGVSGNINVGGGITATGVISGSGLNAGGSGITTSGNIAAVGTVTAAAFAVSSDARIKNVLGEYSNGLQAIAQLTPVRYTFKGNDDDHVADDKEYIGLVAQDVEEIMPEMVTMKTGHIDGNRVTDLRMLDTNALVYALVNSCRELLKRIEALEAKVI